MLASLDPPRALRRSLGRCPRCDSRLIQLREQPRARRASDPRTVDELLRLVGVSLLDRRCPECEHRDSIAVPTLGAATWYRDETRRLMALQTLADSIAVAGPLPPIALIEAPAAHSPI
jgi:hypothetical protein